MLSFLSNDILRSPVLGMNNGTFSWLIVVKFWEQIEKWPLQKIGSNQSRQYLERIFQKRGTYIIHMLYNVAIEIQAKNM